MARSRRFSGFYGVRRGRCGRRRGEGMDSAGSSALLLLGHRPSQIAMPSTVEGSYVRAADVLTAAPVQRRHLDDPEVEQHGPGGLQGTAAVEPVPIAALGPSPERRFRFAEVAAGEIVQAAVAMDQRLGDDPLGRPRTDVREEAELGRGLLESVEVLSSRVPQASPASPTNLQPTR